MRVYAVGAAIISLAPSVSGFRRIGSELLDETAKLLGSFRKLPRVFLRISRPPARCSPPPAPQYDLLVPSSYC